MGFGSDEDKEKAQHLKLRTVRLGMSSALGGDVPLALAPRTTVLVGKNGAGKSAILERVGEAFENVWGVAKSSRPDPGSLSCEFDFDDVALRYQCSWSAPEEPVLEEATGAELARIDEKCTLLGPDEELLWSVVDGVLLHEDGTKTVLSPGRTLVGGSKVFNRHKEFALNPMVGPLYEWFSSAKRIDATTPRYRREVIIPARFFAKAAQQDLLQHIAWQLTRWQEELPDIYEEFVELGHRLQVFDNIAIKRYVDPDKNAPEASRKDLISISVDGVDLGLLSDGTVRAIRISMGLVQPGVSLLMIDEPEAAAHPGLLSRLLAEFEAYSDDRQIVIATQSPQVVNWARPDAIRLVERQDGHTHVRSLDAATLERVERYLHDDDSLGSFIYGGGTDGIAG